MTKRLRLTFETLQSCQSSEYHKENKDNSDGKEGRTAFCLERKQNLITLRFLLIFLNGIHKEQSSNHKIKIGDVFDDTFHYSTGILI